MKKALLRVFSGILGLRGSFPMSTIAGAGPVVSAAVFGCAVAAAALLTGIFAIVFRPAPKGAPAAPEAE